MFHRRPGDVIKSCNQSVSGVLGVSRGGCEEGEERARPLAGMLAVGVRCVFEAPVYAAYACLSL